MRRPGVLGHFAHELLASGLQEIGSARGRNAPFAKRVAHTTRSLCTDTFVMLVAAPSGKYFAKFKGKTPKLIAQLV